MGSDEHRKSRGLGTQGASADGPASRDDDGHDEEEEAAAADDEPPSGSVVIAGRIRLAMPQGSAAV